MKEHAADHHFRVKELGSQKTGSLFNAARYLWGADKNMRIGGNPVKGWSGVRRREETAAAAQTYVNEQRRARAGRRN